MKRDGRSSYTGELKCIYSKIMSFEELDDDRYLVWLESTKKDYIVNREMFDYDELAQCMLKPAFFQTMLSGGMRSICDLVN